jgi:hypothetical protein
MASGRDASLDGWTVKREGSTHVLVHEGKPSPHDSFAVAIFSPLHYRDVQVSVRFKAIGRRAHRRRRVEVSGSSESLFSAARSRQGRSS